MISIQNIDRIAPLPKDIRNEIFKYLPLRDTCMCARVCKLWKVIFEDNDFWTVLLKDYKFIKIEDPLITKSPKQAYFNDRRIRHNVHHLNYRQSFFLSCEAFDELPEICDIITWGNDLIVKTHGFSGFNHYLVKDDATFKLLDCPSHALTYLAVIHNKLIAGTYTGTLMEIFHDSAPKQIHSFSAGILHVVPFQSHMLVVSKELGFLEKSKMSLISHDGMLIKTKSFYIDEIHTHNNQIILGYRKHLTFLNSDFMALPELTKTFSSGITQILSYEDKIIVNTKLTAPMIKSGQSDWEPLNKHLNSASSLNIIAKHIVCFHQACLVQGSHICSSHVSHQKWIRICDLNSPDYDKSLKYEGDLKMCVKGEKIFTVDKNDFKVLTFDI
ncbi:MAG: F-box protein [Parachlamydiales bacterium]|nr:F-box protein [Parachlamydiales bacterium]